MTHYSKISWATELGIDLEALELERPQAPLQLEMSDVHSRRARAFADYTRHRATNKAFQAEAEAWAEYAGLTRTVCDFTGVPVPAVIIAREQTRREIVEVSVLRNTCDRCGFLWTPREPRLVGGLCSSCLALQEKVLRRGRRACQPWQGRFAADDVTPVNAQGAPILPGARYCGNSDCVNPKHITKGKRNV